MQGVVHSGHIAIDLAACDVTKLCLFFIPFIFNSNTFPTYPLLDIFHHSRSAGLLLPVPERRS